MGEKSLEKGIGGWLFVFILTLGLTAFVNAQTLFSEFYGLLSVKSMGLDKLITPNFYPFMFLEIIILGITTVFNIFSLFYLIKIEPGAVKITKYFLWGLVLGNMLIFSLLVSLKPFSDDTTTFSTIGAGLSGVIRSVIYAAIWGVYLSKSTRVKATYLN